MKGVINTRKNEKRFQLNSENGPNLTTFMRKKNPTKANPMV